MSRVVYGPPDWLVDKFSSRDRRAFGFWTLAAAAVGAFFFGGDVLLRDRTVGARAGAELQHRNARGDRVTSGVAEWTAADSVLLAEELASDRESVIARRFRPPFADLTQTVDVLVYGERLLAYRVAPSAADESVATTKRISLSRLHLAAQAGGGEEIPLTGFGFWAGE